MSADEDQIFDLEVFVWHLAAHLCGPQILLGQLRTTSEQHCQTHKRQTARLYWRSTSLLEDQANTASQQEAASASAGPQNEQQRCAFIDAIFEFGLTKPPDIPNDGVAHPTALQGTDAPLIRMRWGSLWLQSSDQDSSVGRYFSGTPVTSLDLEAHFGDDGPLNVDLHSTEASVLALQMAQGLMSLTHHANDWTDPSLTIPLRYEKISDQLAPLQVAKVADTPSCQPIDPCLLDMILLQHSFASTSPQSNSIQTSVLATEEELKELANFIENEWKPIVCVGSPEKPRSSPPKPNAEIAAANIESGNDGEGTKRKLVPIPKKPVAFRGKGGGVTRVGGKKKKKNLYE